MPNTNQDTITIDQALRQKQALAEAIKTHVEAFSAATGLKVERVSVDPLCVIGGSRSYLVDVEVSL